MTTKKILLFLICATSSLLPYTRLMASAPTDVRTTVQVLSGSTNKTALSMELLLANKQIGEALYNYSKSSANLSSLFINDTYRNQGYGSKLFRLVCAMLKKKGCTELTFNACAFEFSRNNQPYELSALVSFFENLGASVVKYQDYVHGMPTTAVMIIYL